MRVVVLVTDGEQTTDGDDSTAIAQADVLKQEGVKVCCGVTVRPLVSESSRRRHEESRRW